MASATPWGGLAQAQGAAEAVDSYSKHHDEKYSDRETTPVNSAEHSSEEGEKVHDLARTFTQRSIRDPSGDHINPFDGTDNPLLDPLSGKFSQRAWIKNLIGIESRDPERYPKRTAGVAYRNLGAHGFGEATDYQKTFGNYPLEAGGLFKRMIGRRQQTKIQILKDFDGLVRSGEMLVVLGRPGR